MGAVGFGTNGINEEEVILAAIQSGYRFFDTAVMYNNIDTIASAIKKSNIDRREFFINFKVPPINIEYIDNELNKAAELFNGYVDCLMFHNMNGPDLHEFIKQLLLKKGRTFFYFGASNTDLPHRLVRLKNADWFTDKKEKQKIIDRESYILSQIELVQNLHAHRIADSTLPEWQKLGVMHMGYGVFGGRDDGPCGRYGIVEHPAYNLSPIEYPALNAIADRLKVEATQVVLAYQSLASFQIPSTKKRDRMERNLHSTLAIMEQLTSEDINAIGNDLALVDTHQLETYKNSPSWQDQLRARAITQPRQRLLDHLLTMPQLSPMLETLTKACYDWKDKVIHTFLHFLEEADFRRSSQIGHEKALQEALADIVAVHDLVKDESFYSLFHNMILNLTAIDYADNARVINSFKERIEFFSSLSKLNLVGEVDASEFKQTVPPAIRKQQRVQLNKEMTALYFDDKINEQRTMQLKQELDYLQRSSNAYFLAHQIDIINSEIAFLEILIEENKRKNARISKKFQSLRGPSRTVDFFVMLDEESLLIVRSFDIEFSINDFKVFLEQQGYRGFTSIGFSHCEFDLSGSEQELEEPLRESCLVGLNELISLDRHEKQKSINKNLHNATLHFKAFTR